jgi:N-acetylmuramoyl-L-alanine amidase
MMVRGTLARVVECRRSEWPRRRHDCLRHMTRWSVIGLTVSTALAAWFSPRDVLTVRPTLPVSAGKVWLVQSTPQFDLYSNGLRVEAQFATSTAPRRYVALAHGAREVSTMPAGIVYHTTESHLAPFEEKQNEGLRRDGEEMLDYVQRHRSYHFVIDRFGRVFKVVREGDYANHAGNSVWADESRIYINLNQSFLGVAFEARSESNGLEATVNAAQIYAGRILTEMLRARYGIAASNCVAHAQVSVNPDNFGVGYHQDWAANLPFRELGLGDNYRLALPSMTLFGFARREAGMAVGAPLLPGMSAGVGAAESQLRAGAAAQNMRIERYRGKLHERYRDAIRALRGNRA